MMDDGCHSRKEHVVAHITHDQAVRRTVDEVEARPTLRDEDSMAHGSDGTDQLTADVRRRRHAAEADKHRGRPTLEKRFEVCRKGRAIGEYPRAGLEDPPPRGGGYRGECGIGSEPGVIG